MGKLLSMHKVTTLTKCIIFIFPKIFSLVKPHTCLNIILVFYMTEHANLPIYSTDKFTHRRHFANSAMCCRFLRFLPSHFAFMIRKVPLFLPGIIRRMISLMTLSEIRCFCNIKIFDVVELFWRIIASTLGHVTCLLEIYYVKAYLHDAICQIQFYSGV